MMHIDKRMLPIILALVLSLMAPRFAQAHYLWIERQGAVATIYFGEIEESARERSPGRLDEIPAPQARLLSNDESKPVPLQKRPDGFVFSSTGSRRQALLAEEGAVGVKDWTAAGIGVVKPFFYARHQSLQGLESKATPVLLLDILPTPQPGTFQVFFRGEPLPKADVKIVAPNTWAQEGKTGSDGRVRLPMPWRGQYVLQVVHRENRSGIHDGKAYEAMRHRATLTVVATKGQP